MELAFLQQLLFQLLRAILLLLPLYPLGLTLFLRWLLLSLLSLRLFLLSLLLLLFRCMLLSRKFTTLYLAFFWFSLSRIFDNNSVNLRGFSTISGATGKEE